MYDLTRIDLGKDEAEQDQRLREYFLKTANYRNALSGKKTIIIGRKGSGKSAIFTLMQEELKESGALVIPITPDQYSWSALKDCKEKGILPQQAHTNAWKLTLLASVICKLSEAGLISRSSELIKNYPYLKDSFVPGQEDQFFNIVRKVKELLTRTRIDTPIVKVGPLREEPDTAGTPLSIIEKVRGLLRNEWPLGERVRILIDRLDDSWDASEEAQNLIIGLLKAANGLNATFAGEIVVTVFLRSDIYDNLFFDDQDKLRQYEERLYWKSDELKAVICERVRVSLSLDEPENDRVWQSLFSPKPYRSRASAEKYIIDRTFKRPRDIISFVRLAIEVAIRKDHSVIEPEDTRLAEEENYSQSKYKDLIIEYRKQFSCIQNLLDSLDGSSHRLSREGLLQHLAKFIKGNGISCQEKQVLKMLFVWGVIGIKRQGRAGVKQRGGVHFHYYYDDPSIRPLSYDEYYIHPSLRHYLNIKEKRRKQ